MIERHLYEIFYFIISGVHTYFDIVIKLRDVCERGEAWRTWENMELIDRSDPEAGFEGTEYQGGNSMGIFLARVLA